MNIKHKLIIGFLGLAVFSCTTKTEKPDVVAALVDSTVAPTTDFYQYALGGWLKKNAIPSNEASWGVGNLVSEEIKSRLKSLIEEAGKNPGNKGSESQLIGDFWNTGMDSAAIQKAGITPLNEYLFKINQIQNTQHLFETIQLLHQINVETGFGFYIQQDLKQSEKYQVYFYQGGLGLPERSYYVDNTARIENIRQAYFKYINAVLAFTGNKTPMADAVFQLEKNLAIASRKLEDLRDNEANYNKMPANALVAAKGLSWISYLKMFNIKNDTIIVGQPEFFKALAQAIETTDLNTWKAYLTFHLLDNYAFALHQPLVEANFNFKGKVLNGIETMQPRWKRVVRTIENNVGFALGKLYVKNYYTPETKKRYEDLTNNILATFKERLLKLSWMSDATKQQALQKLATIRKKVGYPDQWISYESMEISNQSYATNVINANKWKVKREIAKLPKPVDKEEWSMTPQTYNAYYDPTNNEIVLPAAIFVVPGYKDEELDDAIIYSYGGASTIGHELIHGFDDQGRSFDAKGNLTNWWTKKDEAEFILRANKMVDLFNSYVLLDSMRVNGKATLGENIADFGGIVVGLDAFKKTEQFKSGQKIAGYTPLQRFFMGYALAWMYSERDEYLANQLLTDVHAPAKLRVNAPYRCVSEFYETYGVKPTDAMYLAPDKRAVIW